MPCLKIVPDSYVNSDALDCLVHKYIYPKSHTIGGLSVDPAHAAEQMKLVKNRREGKTVYYSLADGHIQNIISQGMEHIME